MPANKDQLAKLRAMRANLRKAEKLAGIGKEGTTDQQNAYHAAESQPNATSPSAGPVPARTPSAGTPRNST